MVVLFLLECFCVCMPCHNVHNRLHVCVFACVSPKSKMFFPLSPQWWPRGADGQDLQWHRSGLTPFGWGRCPFTCFNNLGFYKDAASDWLTVVLCALIGQRDRDLELAARIGQSLLQRNHLLQERNEALEEQLAQALDQVVYTHTHTLVLISTF